MLEPPHTAEYCDDIKREKLAIHGPVRIGIGLFYLTPALLFFLLAALVSAELATGWPEEGGIFVWVKNGLG